MNDDARFQDLTRRLAEAEQTLRAIFSGQADAVVYPVSGTPLLLHQAQEALLESEARYRGLVTRMSALVFEATPDGALVFVNEALTPISGYRPEEVLGQNWRNLITRPDQLSAALELLPLLKVGDVTGYELTLRAKDGSPVTLELSSANRYAADGTLQRMVGLGIDRTRHKRAEQQRDQALHDLGERVKELTVLQRASRLLQDHARPIAGLLQELVELLPPAYQYPEIASARIVLDDQEFATPNHAPSPWMLWANLGQRGIIEVCYLKERPVEAEGPFLAEERALLNTLAEMLQAHLERRQVEEERAASEIRFRTLAQTTSAAIFIVEGLGILYANDAAQGLTGYTCDELLNMELWQLAHPTYQDLIRQNGLKHPWGEAIPNRFELRVQTKGGEDRWWDVTTGSLEYEGKPAFVVTAFDITERDRAEKALRKAKEELQVRVAERTAELRKTAEQLQAANAELRVQAVELKVAGEELVAQNDELRAAQQTLETERKRYHELFDFAPGGYLVSDLNGTIREANRAATEMLDVLAERLVGKPLTVYVNEPEHTGLYARLAELQRTQTAQTWEMHLAPRQGESFPALVDVTPARDAQGQLVGLRWLLRDITERKRAEEEIASLAKFPAENPNPILRVSQDGVLHYANAASDALLHEWDCAVGGHVPEFWRNLVASAFTSQSETTIEVECQKRVYSFAVVPIAEAGYVNLYVRDVTVRKRAEEALSESEEKLRTLFELLPVGVSVLDAEHKIAYANPALEKIVQTTREGLRRGGYKTRTYLRPGGTSMPAEEFASSRAIREQSAVHNVETGIELEGGKVIWTNVSAVPVAFSDWKVVIVTTDITERRRAEQALKESEEWHRLALDAADLGTWRHDLATGILHLDERGHLNYGFDTDTVSLAQVLACVHPDDVARVEQEIGAVLNPETSTGRYATEYRVLYPDGSVRWLSVHVRIHFAGQGAERQPVTGFGTCQDITARKKREEELHRLNRTLRAHSHSDQALMRVTTETEYMQEVCKIIVEDCGHAMVWIGLAEEDEGKAVRPVAYAGFEEGYLETLHITWADTERGRGPTGTAVRTGKPSFCRNMLTDPQFTPWRAEALKRGYASSLVLPLQDDGRAFGALTVYFREPDPFTEDEVKLLAGLADDLAYGIRTIRLRMAHARAGEALLQSEERFSKAFYNSPVGITLTRMVDGSFTDINQTFLKMTGLQREDVIGHNSAKLNLTPDVEYSGALLKHVRETGGFRDAEFQVRVKNGELRHWLVNAQTLALGADEFILGMLVDITQRKQAEEALRRAKDELELRVQERTAELERANTYNRSLIEASLDPLVTIGPDGKITDVNAATELVTAYSRRELVGTDFSDYFTKPESARAVYRRVFDEGSVRNFELELVHRDGHLTSVLYNASVYRDKAGQVVGVFAAARDITKRKLAEEQLRLQSAALEAAANGIIITDVQANIQWANPAFARMTGYARGEVIGQHTRFLKSGMLARQDYQQLWETILSGQVWRGQIVNRRKDGSLYTEEQTIAPVLNAEAEITNFVAIKQDITDRKRAEAQLERNNEELRALSQAERSQRLLAETLSAANLALTQTLDLATVMETLLDYVGRLVPYDSANVMLLEAESRLSVRVARGYERWVDAGQSRAITFDVQVNPILKELFTTRKSILVPDTRTHPGWEIRPGAEHVQSWLGVPLMAGGNVIGVYSLDKTEPAFFTQEHVRRAEMLVGQAAVAIQNAWLFEQVRAGRERLQSLSRRLVEVQEAERHYVARELHDEVGQALTSLKFSLGQLGAETDPAQHAARIAGLKHMTDEVLESLHRLAMNLRPASLDHLGLVSALNQYVRAIGDRYGLIAQFKAVDMGERLPPTVETALYRIVQEALTNVVRHARATRVDVLLERRGDQVIVVIEDNGLGFDAQAAHPAQSGHLGLVGMQERAEMLGGSFVIESTVGAGTTVAVEVPDVYSHPHRG